MIKAPTNLQEPWVPGQGCRQTVRMRGVREPALKLRFTWEGLHLENGVQSRGQNRTREIRPSGIVGGLAETWVWSELNGHVQRKRRNSQAQVLQLRAPQIYPDNRKLRLRWRELETDPRSG